MRHAPEDHDEQRAARHPGGADGDAEDGGDTRCSRVTATEQVAHAHIRADAKRHGAHHERQPCGV